MTKLPYERPLILKMNAGLMNKFGTRTEYVPVKQIDGVPVKQLIETYGSPVFVISERTIRKTYQNSKATEANNSKEAATYWSLV